MRGKLLQTIFLFLATSFVFFSVIVITETAAVTVIAATYTAVMGIFLGLDLAVMIHRTHNLKRGDYKEIDVFKYVTALGLFFALLAETFCVSRGFNRELNGLYLCFGVGFLIVCGGLIAGVEANKIVTNEGPDK
jgi:FtsH-binding integral membrane protein